MYTDRDLLLLKNLANQQDIARVVFDHEDVAQWFHCGLLVVRRGRRKVVSGKFNNVNRKEFLMSFLYDLERWYAESSGAVGG